VCSYGIYFGGLATIKDIDTIVVHIVSLATIVSPSIGGSFPYPHLAFYHILHLKSLFSSCISVTNCVTVSLDCCFVLYSIVFGNLSILCHKSAFALYK
jgi:hypothetical protein